MLKPFTLCLYLISVLIPLLINNIQTAAIAENRLRIAELILAEGVVERKQAGESEYKTVQVTVDLFHGDLLRVRRGGRAIIRCTSNGMTWLIPDDNIPRGVANTCTPPS
ncbi:hypothetical protein [Spirulina subsalsa]|uniref:hypothetical protein n=1 Tax=Spirulina subsalsa TaxID=54311 RepID=UPI00030640E8|nr:hypothetical protein [Spirulina subsalsa]